jgi:hypothetical protein
VGKASRHKRDQREATKFAASAELAARADAALALVVSAVEKGLTDLRTDRGESKLDLARWALVRQRFLDDRATWPSWSWLPFPMVVGQLDREMQKLVPGLPDGDMNAYAALLAPILNWLPGRTAVLFDRDVLASFSGAPDGERIPVQALYRLPGWGLYLHCPFISENAGVFVCLEPADVHWGDVTAPPGTVDELTMTLVLPDNSPDQIQVLYQSLRLSEDTVAGSLAAQAEATSLRDLSPIEAQTLVSPEVVADLVGQPMPQLLSTVTAMVLYLCIDEPDIIEQRVPGPVRQDKREPGSGGDVRVLKAGWRLGAALRAAKARYEAGLADPTGRTVSPHLRRPHWHSYWIGPRGDPEARQLVLRYLPPIQVGSELPDVTVVRPASQ